MGATSPGGWSFWVNPAVATKTITLYSLSFILVSSVIAIPISHSGLRKIAHRWIYRLECACTWACWCLVCVGYLRRRQISATDPSPPTMLSPAATSVKRSTIPVFPYSDCYPRTRAAGSPGRWPVRRRRIRAARPQPPAATLPPGTYVSGPSCWGTAITSRRRRCPGLSPDSASSRPSAMDRRATDGATPRAVLLEPPT